MVSELISSVFDNIDLIRLVLSHVTDVEVIGRAAQCCRALSAHAYSDEVMQPACKTMEPPLVSGAWLDPIECEVICAPAVLSTNAKVYEEITARAKHHPWWARQPRMRLVSIVRALGIAASDESRSPTAAS